MAAQHRRRGGRAPGRCRADGAPHDPARQHFWDNWKSYPFSATEWNHRPLDVQALALAYRSGAAWNETGFANAEFDALLARAMALVDADTRREVMARIEKLLRAEGVIIQPYWRALYTHHVPGASQRRKAPVTRNPPLQDRLRA